MPLAQIDEFFYGEVSRAQDGTQSSAIQFFVIRHDKLSKWFIPPQDEMAAMLAFYSKPHLCERFDTITPGYSRQLRHG